MKNILYFFLTALISSVALLTTTEATFDPELVYSTVILIWLLYIWYHIYAKKRNYSE